MSAPDPITPATALCGIVLHPAGHTRSPAMHNAAFRALGVDAVYLAFDVPSARLAEAIVGARVLGARQLSISLPHKVEVMEHLDSVDATARRIGAVNTVTRQPDGSLTGANTDWLSAVHALERETPLAGLRAVVLGAGGAARGVVFGLLERGARVTVLNRTEERARALARELEAHGSGPLDAVAGTAYDVLVNTTAVGLVADESPLDPAWIRPDALVMDTIYEPERTRLLRDAEARGARTLGGKWMLVYQAAEQLRIWTGRDVPVDVLAKAFDEAGKRS